MGTRIKICGIRRKEDIAALNRCRPDYAGFILSEGFRRSIDAETFYELESMLDKDIRRVGVFVDEDLKEIGKSFISYLDVIQLHGHEDDDYIRSLKSISGAEIWKAVRAKTADDIEKADSLDCDRLVIDSYVKGIAGGTGREADTEVIKAAKVTKPFFIAGGVGENNAARLIGTLKPYGADISGSVETDGFKDEMKIKHIITLIRSI